MASRCAMSAAAIATTPTARSRLTALLARLCLASQEVWPSGQWNGRRRSRRSEAAGAAARCGSAGRCSAWPSCWPPRWPSPVWPLPVGRPCPIASAKSIPTICAFASTSRSSTSADRARPRGGGRAPAAGAERRCPQPARGSHGRRARGRKVSRRACCWCRAVSRSPNASCTLLEEEHRAYPDSLDRGDHARRAVRPVPGLQPAGGAGRPVRGPLSAGLAESLPSIAGVCVLVVVTLGLALLLSRPPWHAEFVPLTLTALILTLAYNPQFALLMSFSLATWR